MGGEREILTECLYSIEHTVRNQTNHYRKWQNMLVTLCPIYMMYSNTAFPFTDEVLLRNYPAESSLYLVRNAGTFWLCPRPNHTIASQLTLAQAWKGDETRDVSLYPSSELFAQEEFAFLGTCSQQRTRPKKRQSDTQCMILGSQL